MPFPPPPRGRQGSPTKSAHLNSSPAACSAPQRHRRAESPRRWRAVRVKAPARRASAPRGVKAGPPGPARAPRPDLGPAACVDGAASVQRASTAACRTDSTRRGGGARSRRCAGAARSSAPPGPPHAAPPARRAPRPSPAGASARRAPAMRTVSAASMPARSAAGPPVAARARQSGVLVLPAARRRLFLSAYERSAASSPLFSAS